MAPPDATVLLIDDDADVRDALERLLRSAGWRSESYGSADAFLACASFDGLGCILLDIRMAGMDGMALHEWIRANGVTLPVIFLSAHCDVPISVQAMKRGAVDVLQKPVDADVLLAAIADAVERNHQDRLRRDAVDEIEVRVDSLSPREREVMNHVIVGRLNKQIAADLGITEKTVKVHRARAMAKMRVRSVAELVHLCDQVGLTA